MKVELVIKTGWAETEVTIDGNKSQVERVVEAIKKAFSKELYTEIK